MAFTNALDVSIGAATKASDYDSLADNTEFNREKADAEHDLDISTGAGKHKSISFLNSTDVIQLKAGSASLPSLTAEGDLNTGLYFPAADTISIVVGGTEAIRFDDSGAVGINNTPSAVTTAQFWVESATAGANICRMIQSHASDPYGHSILFTNYSPDNNTHWFASYADSTTTRFRVYSDGDVVNHDNSYGAISDAKLKADILSARDYWDDFKAVQFRTFLLNKDIEQYGAEAGRRFGVVAQELEQVFPSLVIDSPDIDIDGNDLGTTTKSVKYSVLAQIALKVVQELQERVEVLEAQILPN